MLSKSLLAAAVALSLSGAAFAANETRSSTVSPGAASATDPARSAPATPDTSANPDSREFFKLDADGDGTLSKKEAAKNKSIQKQWSKLDANKDGKLDTLEFSQFELMPVDDSLKR